MKFIFLPCAIALHLALANSELSRGQQFMAPEIEIELPLKLVFRSNMADSIEIKETKADENPGATLLLNLFLCMNESFFQFSISDL